MIPQRKGTISIPLSGKDGVPTRTAVFDCTAEFFTKGFTLTRYTQEIDKGAMILEFTNGIVTAVGLRYLRSDTLKAEDMLDSRLLQSSALRKFIEATENYYTKPGEIGFTRNNPWATVAVYKKGDISPYAKKDELREIVSSEKRLPAVAFADIDSSSLYSYGFRHVQYEPENEKNYFGLFSSETRILYPGAEEYNKLPYSFKGNIIPGRGQLLEESYRREGEITEEQIKKMLGEPTIIRQPEVTLSSQEVLEIVKTLVGVVPQEYSLKK